MRVIYAAVVGDRQGVVEASKALGYLTGYESKVKLGSYEHNCCSYHVVKLDSLQLANVYIIHTLMVYVHIEPC